MLIVYISLPTESTPPLAVAESHSVHVDLSAVRQVHRDRELLRPGAVIGVAQGVAVAQRNG